VLLATLFRLLPADTAERFVFVVLYLLDRKPVVIHKSEEGPHIAGPLAVGDGDGVRTVGAVHSQPPMLRIKRGIPDPKAKPEQYRNMAGVGVISLLPS
jgi:hypothetical protein